MLSDMPDADVSQWRAWLAQGELRPYFQAIHSVQNQGVFGFEVLGRRIDPDGYVHSLGQFFESGGTADPYSPIQDLKREVDLTLRSQALERFQREAPDGSCLFINMPPSLMARWTPGEDNDPVSIRMIRAAGIDPRRIVIEITEEAFPGQLEPFLQLVARYRREGYRIALDDVGAESSNLDRMGLFHPDIVKVDLALIKRSVDSRNFREILFGLARLAESMGCELLFEGVETDEELFNAFDKGASYLQGFRFSWPVPHFEPEKGETPAIVQALDAFHTRKIGELRLRAQREAVIQHLLARLPLQVDRFAGRVSIGERTLEFLGDKALRIYVTDAKGRQVSPNYQHGDEGWEEDVSYLGSNWSTRPYFFDHIYQTSANWRSRWSMSDTYWDISAQALVRTFSRTIGRGEIIFVDVRVVQ